MSLFENDEYQWRETYFILFPDEKHPSSEAVLQALKKLNPRYQVRDVRADATGRLESLTIESPDDYSGIDVSLVQGEEVTDQTQGLMKDLLKGASEEERANIRGLAKYTSRFDVYHFEQLVFVGRDDDAGDEDEEFLDPGSVLIVMERIASLCGGVIVDPQANVIL